MDYQEPLHVVFVHGLFSSADTWASMKSTLESDQVVSGRTNVHFFAYSSPKFQLARSKRIPSLDDVASVLGLYLDTTIPPNESIILVAHSQGGLIVQKFITDRLRDGKGLELQQIRGIALYATPNSGSEFFLTTRRAIGGLFKNPQEQELRPFVASLADTQRQFLKSVVYADAAGSHQCPIPVVAFGAAEDAIVSAASARSLFPNGGVLPGTHSSIIRPDDSNDPRYRVLRNLIAEALMKLSPNPSATLSIEINIPAETIADTEPVLSPATSDSGKARIVRALLEVPEFRDEADRREIIRFLPPYVAADVRSGQSSRIALMSLVTACDRFGLPGRLALLEALDIACPSEDPRVRLAIRTVCGAWNLPSIDS